MSKKGGLSGVIYGTIMPKIYGIGAAIVIIGAMFKILHLPGADLALKVGLSTEAIVFLFSAFQPQPKEYEWEKLYPELSDEYEGTPSSRKAATSGENGSVTKKLDHMLESAKIGPELINSLGQGMKNLAESAAKMSSLSNAAVATNEYANNVKLASKSLVDMNKSYATTVTAMADMANASKDAKEYHTQVQNVTKNLGALNAVYEMELKDANSHLKAMNKFYSNISNAMESMAQASKDTEQFKNELAKLTSNLNSLNKVYGSVLTAMKGQA